MSSSYARETCACKLAPRPAARAPPLHSLPFLDPAAIVSLLALPLFLRRLERRARRSRWAQQHPATPNPRELGPSPAPSLLGPPRVPRWCVQPRRRCPSSRAVTPISPAPNLGLGELAAVRLGGLPAPHPGGALPWEEALFRQEESTITQPPRVEVTYTHESKEADRGGFTVGWERSSDIFTPHLHKIASGTQFVFVV